MTIASLLIALITAIPSSAATSEPVLLDFHAEWCGPCRQMRPAMAQLSRKGYPIKSIDIDQAPDLKEKYGVDAVPTFIVVDPHGRELGRTSGSQPAAQLARFYLDAKAKRNHPPTPAPTPTAMLAMTPTARPTKQIPTVTPLRRREAGRTRMRGRNATTRSRPSRNSRIPSRGKPWSASGSWARVPSASAPAR